MSQTLSLGIVGPSYWTYTSFVMAQRLSAIAEKGGFTPDDIPKGVLRDAQKLFQLILQNFNGGPPQTTAASSNAYLIARDVIKRTERPTPETGQEVRKILERYHELLQTLTAPRKLTEGERQTAESLQRFFDGLHQAGASEHYLSVVQMAPPSVSDEPL